MKSVCPVKPMRAFKVKDDQLDMIHYPCYASPKFDGIRSIVLQNTALSNSLLPIRNTCVQNLLCFLNFCDGELVAGNNFQDTSSVIMSESGGPGFTYYVFDSFMNPQDIFINRLKDLESTFLQSGLLETRIQIVQHVKIRDMKELLKYEEDMLQLGYEGIMLRHPHGRYKFGRSTFNEQFLLKRKPVVDEEAIIIGFEEQEENLNEALIDNRGFTKRSSHQENKRGKDTLGAFVVQSARWETFRIGTGLGLTEALRKEIWQNKERYIGKLITFKYQEYGSKDKPRQPIFIRFRHQEDCLISL